MDFNYSAVIARVVCDEKDFVSFRNDYFKVKNILDDEVGSDDFNVEAKKEFTDMTFQARGYLIRVFPHEKDEIMNLTDENIYNMFSKIFPAGICLW